MHFGQRETRDALLLRRQEKRMGTYMYIYVYLSSHTQASSVLYIAKMSQHRDPHTCAHVRYLICVIACTIFDPSLSLQKRDNVAGPLFVVQKSKGSYGLRILNQQTPLDWTLNVKGDLDHENIDNFLFLRQNKNDKTTKCIWFHNEVELAQLTKLLVAIVRVVQDKAKPSSKHLLRSVHGGMKKTKADTKRSSVPAPTVNSISREELRKTLLDLIKDDSFLDTIHAAYSARFR